MSHSKPASLYALFIGIDAYSRQSLDGCINDVCLSSQFLQAHCERTGLNWKPFHLIAPHQSDQDREDIQQLIAQNPMGYQSLATCRPTVERVSKDGFSFFQAAQPGDICLLYYSGHGTRVNAPAAFARQSADKMNQAIVLLPEPDPVPGNSLHFRDLLIDKELGYLIWQSLNGESDIHFVAIMDCCYAGDVTRTEYGVKERSMAFARDVDLKYYIGLDKYDRLPQADGTIKYEVPFAHHILLAAAQPDQTAKELIFEIKHHGDDSDPQSHGLFTYHLINELQKGGYSYSYNQLIERIKFQLEAKVINQYPQIDAVGQNDYPYQPFLGGEAQLNISQYQIFYSTEDKSWLLNAGSIHGILPPLSKNGPFTLLEQTDLAPGTPKPKLKVTQVMSRQSKVEFISAEEELDTEQGPISVQLIQLATTPIVFSPGHSIPRKTWEQFQQLGKRLRYATLAPYEETGQYIIHRDAMERYYATSPGSNLPIFRRSSEPIEFLNNLKLLAHWLFIRDQKNINKQAGLPSTLLNIDFQKVEGVKLTKDNMVANADLGASLNKVNFDLADNQDLLPSVHLSYKFKNGQWLKPGFRLKIGLEDKMAYRYPGKYYISVLYLSSKFGIDNQFLAHEILEPGKDQSAEFSFDVDLNGQPHRFTTIRLSVEDQYLKNGITEITDYIKIYVSKSNFNTNSLVQKGLELDPYGAATHYRSQAKSIDFPIGQEQDLGSAWTVLTIPIKIHRPLESLKDVGLDLNAGSAKSYGFAQVNSLFSGQLKWGSSQLLENHNLPGYFTQGSLPCVFSDLQQGGSGLNLDYIDFTFDQERSFEGRRSTDIAPVKISEIAALNKEEAILPLVIDEENQLIIPVGLTIDQTLEIHRVSDSIGSVNPSPNQLTTRSIRSAYRVFFKKFLLDRYTRKKEFPKLSFLFSGKANQSDIKEAISNSNKPIAVFIHGLYGDHDQNAQAFQTPFANGTKLSDHYDVILAFDYENLRTPMEESAAELKKELEKVVHDKTQIHLFGYSTGGLIARYYVEYLKGYEQVTELIMLGTPNGGTIWGEIQQWVVTTITAAINLPAIANPTLLPFLLTIGRFFLKSFNNFKLLQSTDSGILYALSQSYEERNTRYHLIAGNTQKITSDNSPNATSALDKIAQALQNRLVFGTIDIAVFSGQDNDLFASSDSMKACPFLKPENTYDQIPCGHFSYYSHPASLQVVGEIIQKANNF